MAWAAVLAPWLVAATAATTAAGAAPPAGPYSAQLCVSVSGQPASCGPAQAQVLKDGDLRIRIADVVYHLHFQDNFVIGVTLHGAMQVADFASPYRWQGRLLQFYDSPRGLRFELTVGDAQAASAPR